MKKSILLIYMLAICMDMSAYTPLVEEGKQWSVITRSIVLLDGVDCRYNTYIYKFEGEERVNDITYDKLMSTSNEEAYGWTLTALVREEDKKVYAMINDEEYLMFDYNIEVGSKIAIYPSLLYIFLGDSGTEKLKPLEYEVSRVDVVKNKKGEDIKKYSFKNTSFVFYERYGCETGWKRGAGDKVDSDSDDYMVCVHNSKGELEYFAFPPFENVDLEEGQCYASGEVLSIVDEITESSDILFYDNIAKTIGFAVDGEKDVTIYDIQGRRIYKSTVSEKSTSFTAEAGLYIVSVISSGNNYTGKIVVK